MDYFRTKFGSTIVFNLGTFTILLALLAVNAPAYANTFGVQNQLFVQATAPCGPQTTGTLNTGLVQPATPLNNSDTESNTGSYNGQSGSASATGSVSSFYGSLSASGSGTSNPIIGACGSESRSIPYIGGDPNAFFQDRLHVSSSTLANGTAVDLTFALAFTGDASFTNEPAGGYLSSATISDKTTFRTGINDPNIVVQYGAGTYNEFIIVHTVVGDFVDISDAIYGQGEAASFDAGGNASFTYSGSSTLRLDSISSPGVCVTADSGTNYGANGSCGTTATPEPSTFVLLGSVLAVLPAFRRGRLRR